MGVPSEPDFTGAACGGHEVNNFFPERGTAQITARDAKAICNGTPNEWIDNVIVNPGLPVCPVREVCLEYALERKERFGIWGGKSERERARLAKTRRVAARLEELEADRDARRRSEAARRGWENRRRRQVQLEQEAKVVSLGKKDIGGTSKGRRSA